MVMRCDKARLATLYDGWGVMAVLRTADYGSSWRGGRWTTITKHGAGERCAAGEGSLCPSEHSWLLGEFDWICCFLTRAYCSLRYLESGMLNQDISNRTAGCAA